MGEARQCAFLSRGSDEAGAQQSVYDFTRRLVVPNIDGCIVRNPVEGISRRRWHGDVLLSSEIEDDCAFVHIAVMYVRAEVVGWHPSISSGGTPKRVPLHAANGLRELSAQLVLQKHDARALRLRNHVSQFDEHDDFSSFTIVAATCHNVAGRTCAERPSSVN